MGGLFHNLRHPRRCYCVCAVARSGSNLLTDGLHATRRAGKPKQFFLPKFESDYGGRHGLDSAANFAAYVRGIIPTSSTSNEIFGFKVMAWYLGEFLSRLRACGEFSNTNSSELELLRSAFPRIQFVQIVRRDKVRQAISKARAMQSGLWKVQEGNEVVAAPHYDESLITQCLADTRRDEQTWQDFFERNAITPFVVTYEELCADYETQVRAVLSHLKISLPRGTNIAAAQTIRQTDEMSEEWERRYLAAHQERAN